jgi:hypothetical protein
VESLRERRTIRLTKGISPLVGSLKKFDLMEAFSGVSDGMATPPRADFIPSNCGEVLAFA